MHLKPRRDWPLDESQRRRVLNYLVAGYAGVPRQPSSLLLAVQSDVDYPRQADRRIRYVVDPRFGYRIDPPPRSYALMGAPLRGVYTLDPPGRPRPVPGHPGIFDVEP